MQIRTKIDFCAPWPLHSFRLVHALSLILTCRGDLFRLLSRSRISTSRETKRGMRRLSGAGEAD
jgi:hypothetical protein